MCSSYPSIIQYSCNKFFNSMFYSIDNLKTWILKVIILKGPGVVEKLVKTEIPVTEVSKNEVPVIV
jgi:hypothetical protein